MSKYLQVSLCRKTEPRALGATSFISLVFHGLLLGATGLAIPLKTATPPEETGISIDLASIVDPAPVQGSCKAGSAKTGGACAGFRYGKGRSSGKHRAGPMPKKTPKPNPRKAEAPMPRKAAAKNDAPGRAAPSGAMQPDRKGGASCLQSADWRVKPSRSRRRFQASQGRNIRNLRANAVRKARSACAARWMPTAM